MPFTKCPNCSKVQQVTPKLVTKEVGCLNEHCGKLFPATEYRLHSGPMSKVVFGMVITFALFMLTRYVWNNSIWIMYQLG